jgi:hypothetical protein
LLTPTLKTDTRNIQEEFAALSAIPQIVQQAGEKTREVIGARFVEQAQVYPASAKLPFAFATEKSRRWYFAAVQGRIAGVTIPTSGGRYARTRGLANSFYARTIKEQGVFLIEFGTTYPASIYVLGTFDGRRKRQVPGHRNTGWQDIAFLAQRTSEEAIEFFGKTVGTTYSQFRLGQPK